MVFLSKLKKQSNDNNLQNQNVCFLTSILIWIEIQTAWK